ncbi:hypothetical protein GIB67_013735 [Kingdonia uniflora]|uniref:Uncharacterized protein n=1 Tax=Kingdonia uniflora TaxID=39325 RepID=A0A7J7NQ40_9MAGN|nr:hypothetical protein GIB67_013735 [Kingdonia uniflora]
MKAKANLLVASTQFSAKNSCLTIILSSHSHQFQRCSYRFKLHRQKSGAVSTIVSSIPEPLRCPRHIVYRFLHRYQESVSSSGCELSLSHL